MRVTAAFGPLIRGARVGTYGALIQIEAISLGDRLRAQHRRLDGIEHG
jgi:hypothetical protein